MLRDKPMRNAFISSLAVNAVCVAWVGHAIAGGVLTAKVRKDPSEALHPVTVKTDMAPGGRPPDDGGSRGAGRARGDGQGFSSDGRTNTGEPRAAGGEGGRSASKADDRGRQAHDHRDSDSNRRESPDSSVELTAGLDDADRSRDLSQLTRVATAAVGGKSAAEHAENRGSSVEDRVALRRREENIAPPDGPANADAPDKAALVKIAGRHLAAPPAVKRPGPRRGEPTAEADRLPVPVNGFHRPPSNGAAGLAEARSAGGATPVAGELGTVPGRLALGRPSAMRAAAHGTVGRANRTGGAGKASTKSAAAGGINKSAAIHGTNSMQYAPAGTPEAAAAARANAGLRHRRSRAAASQPAGGVSQKAGPPQYVPYHGHGPANGINEEGVVLDAGTERSAPLRALHLPDHGDDVRGLIPGARVPVQDRRWVYNPHPHGDVTPIGRQVAALPQFTVAPRDVGSLSKLGSVDWGPPHPRKQTKKPNGGDGTGLYGMYYMGNDFNHLIVTRPDRHIDYDWTGRLPDPKMPPYRAFSVRWLGKLIPRYTETYTLRTASDDGVRLYLNGRLLISNWTIHAVTEDTATVSLVAGQPYDLKMEYYEKNGTSGEIVKFYWDSPHQVREIVPEACLRYAANAAETHPAATTAR